MTTRITVAILLITWTIIIVCFSTAYFTARETLLAMVDDTLMARAFSVLDYHLHPRDSSEAMIPSGDTYVIRDEKQEPVQVFTDTPAHKYRPVLTDARFETRADGKRYRTLTVHAAPIGANAGAAAPMTITYSRPSDQFERLSNYLIAVLTSLGMFCGLATGWVALKVSRHALLPLTQTAETIAAIDEKNLSQRIDEAKLPIELVPMTKRLNEMLQRLERVFTQRKQFLADAAHELRTPTAALLTTLEVSLRRPRDQRALQETIESALTDARLLRRLVDKLMEQARSDHALEKPVFDQIDLSELLRGCLSTVHPIAAEKDVRVAAEFPPNVAFNTQRDRFHSIAMNLLTNAIEYNRAGGTVELQCESDSEGITLSVRDNGQGISAEALPHVFEPFYRADKQRQSDAEHLGLGLFLVHSHVKALSGTCEIESKPGEGTIVSVRLPHIGKSPQPISRTELATV